MAHTLACCVRPFVCVCVCVSAFAWQPMARGCHEHVILAAPAKLHLRVTDNKQTQQQSQRQVWCQSNTERNSWVHWQKQLNCLSYIANMTTKKNIVRYAPKTCPLSVQCSCLWLTAWADFFLTKSQKASHRDKSQSKYERRPVVAQMDAWNYEKPTEAATRISLGPTADNMLPSIYYIDIHLHLHTSAHMCCLSAAICATECIKFELQIRRINSRIAGLITMCKCCLNKLCNSTLFVQKGSD